MKPADILDQLPNFSDEELKVLTAAFQNEHWRRIDLQSAIIINEGYGSLTKAEKDLLCDDRLIMAVKEIRERLGCSLKEAKMVADRFREHIKKMEEML